MCGTCAKSAFTSLIPSSLAPARATVLIPGTRDWIRVFITQFPCGERTGVPASAMGIKKCATARMHARISRDSVVGWKRWERDSAACRRAVFSRGTAGSGNVHPGSAVRSARHGLRSRGIGPLDPTPAGGHAEDENRRRGSARERTSMGDGSKGWFSPCVTRCDLGVRWLATALAAPRRFPRPAICFRRQPLLARTKAVASHRTPRSPFVRWKRCGMPTEVQVHVAECGRHLFVRWKRCGMPTEWPV